MSSSNGSPFGLLPGMRPNMRSNMTPTIAAGAVILVLLLIWLFRPFTIVDGGYVGVKTFFGAPEQEVLGDGIHAACLHNGDGLDPGPAECLDGRVGQFHGQPRRGCELLEKLP